MCVGDALMHKDRILGRRSAELSAKNIHEVFGWAREAASEYTMAVDNRNRRGVALRPVCELIYLPFHLLLFDN